MKVPVLPLTIPQGSTYIHQFNLDLTDFGITDLTEYEARIQVRKRYNDTELLYFGNSDSNEHIVTQTGGLLLTIPAAVTGSWGFKRAVYDIEVFDELGFVLRVVQGKIRVTPEV